jgi:nucleolar protein 14
VSLVAHQQEDAKRFVPEALNFLQNALMLLSPLDKKGKAVARKACMDYAIPTPDFEEQHTKAVGLGSGKKSALLQASKPDLFSLLGAEESSPEAGVALLSVTLALIDVFADMYEGTAAYIELFEPFRLVVDSVPSSALPSNLAEQLSGTSSHLATRLTAAQATRRPLRLHAHRAIPLASFIPKFDSSGGSRYARFSSGSNDPDAARAEASKLKALVKKERKGAVRELRKDSQFLAAEKARERKVEEDEYKRKIGKIVSGLGEERSEQKMLEREKSRLKKRAGGGKS